MMPAAGDPSPGRSRVGVAARRSCPGARPVPCPTWPAYLSSVLSSTRSPAFSMASSTFSSFWSTRSLALSSASSRNPMPLPSLPWPRWPRRRQPNPAQTGVSGSSEASSSASAPASSSSGSVTSSRTSVVGVGRHGVLVRGQVHTHRSGGDLAVARLVVERVGAAGKTLRLLGPRGGHRSDLHHGRTSGSAPGPPGAGSPLGTTSGCGLPGTGSDGIGSSGAGAGSPPGSGDGIGSPGGQWLVRVRGGRHAGAGSLRTVCSLVSPHPPKRSGVLPFNRPRG